MSNFKLNSNSIKGSWRPQTVKMNELSFNDNLFIPMPTGSKVDPLFSADGGLMKGTNYAIVGDPGVGKSTVMLDILADLKSKGKDVLFISGEMNSIDMHGYVKRYPKFGNLDILFMGDYVEKDPLVVLKSILTKGWDVVLIDSMAEVVSAVADFHTGMTNKKAESEILTLLEKHNKANNINKINTAFLIIQQVTKMGEFAGSNRFKHMMTGMAHLKFVNQGRCFFFSKNRRGGQMDALFFSLGTNKNVGWLHTQPMNALD
jgi:predicted ATP-dependent serine protease